MSNGGYDVECRMVAVMWNVVAVMWYVVAVICNVVVVMLMWNVEWWL